MNKLIIQLTLFLVVFSITSSSFSQSNPNNWKSFPEIVDLCKSELKFDSIPRMDCRSVNFRTPIANTNFDLSNDWVAHRQINNSVDVVFACRWVKNNTGKSGAASGEMIVHNRNTGGTCFFNMKNTSSDGFVPQIDTTDPVSPSDKGAEDFWEVQTFCTNCHSAGPYIASPQIVGALSKFGLINDGHDTFADFYYAIEPEFSIDRMGGVYFNNPVMNDQIKNNSPGCAGKCHVLTDNIVDSSKSVGGSIVLPSINLITQDVIEHRDMPPSDPHSDYRWVNRDTPGSTGDWEKMEDIKSEFPQFSCSNPKAMQAHRVDSKIVISTDDLPDNVAVFNLYDGLVCNNDDQPSGKRCADYSTRYKCGDEWTEWQNTDKPTATQDNEARSRIKGLCSNPKLIQARFTVSGKTKTVYGPNDRLEKFDRKGLGCRNSDQPEGKKCHNYVVRFICD